MLRWCLKLAAVAVVVAAVVVVAVQRNWQLEPPTCVLRNCLAELQIHWPASQPLGLELGPTLGAG